MNSFYAIFYSTLFFFILFFLSIYIIKQIINNQLIEKKIKFLENKKQTNDNAEDSYRLGQLYLQKKLFNRCLILLDQALQSWDLNDRIGLASLINTIGFVYFKLNKYDLSIYYYRIAIKILPDFVIAIKNLAFAYESKKLFNEALNYYNICLSFQPNNSFFINKLKYIKRQLLLLSIN